MALYTCANGGITLEERQEGAFVQESRLSSANSHRAQGSLGAGLPFTKPPADAAHSEKELRVWLQGTSHSYASVSPSAKERGAAPASRTGVGGRGVSIS